MLKFVYTKPPRAKSPSSGSPTASLDRSSSPRYRERASPAPFPLAAQPGAFGVSSPSPTSSLDRSSSPRHRDRVSPAPFPPAPKEVSFASPPHSFEKSPSPRPTYPAPILHTPRDSPVASPAHTLERSTSPRHKDRAASQAGFASQPGAGQPSGFPPGSRAAPSGGFHPDTRAVPSSGYPSAPRLIPQEPGTSAIFTRDGDYLSTSQSSLSRDRSSSPKDRYRAVPYLAVPPPPYESVLTQTSSRSRDRAQSGRASPGSGRDRGAGAAPSPASQGDVGDYDQPLGPYAAAERTKVTFPSEFDDSGVGRFPVTDRAKTIPATRARDSPYAGVSTPSDSAQFPPFWDSSKSELPLRADTIGTRLSSERASGPTPATAGSTHPYASGQRSRGAGRGGVKVDKGREPGRDKSWRPRLDFLTGSRAHGSSRQQAAAKEAH
ncbi:hypothetical protein BaRGS_00006793, partial [Batillaria attramentaria]